MQDGNKWCKQICITGVFCTIWKMINNGNCYFLLIFPLFSWCIKEFCLWNDRKEWTNVKYWNWLFYIKVKIFTFEKVGPANFFFFAWNLFNDQIWLIIWLINQTSCRCWFRCVAVMWTHVKVGSFWNEAILTETSGCFEVTADLSW